MTEILDIVDQHDRVIGRAERKRAHADGLKIRLVYVWFYTPDRKVILQRRSKLKRAFPDRLVSTVSGHVESGMTYLDSAVKETSEETGVNIDLKALRDAGKTYYCTHTKTADISDAFRTVYAYPYEGTLNDLVVETGEGNGFELWNIPDLFVAMDNDPDNFSPFIVSEHMRAVLERIRDGDIR